MGQLKAHDLGLLSCPSISMDRSDRAMASRGARRRLYRTLRLRVCQLVRRPRGGKDRLWICESRRTR